MKLRSIIKYVKERLNMLCFSTRYVSHFIVDNLSRDIQCIRRNVISTTSVILFSLFITRKTRIEWTNANSVFPNASIDCYRQRGRRFREKYRQLHTRYPFHHTIYSNGMQLHDVTVEKNTMHVRATKMRPNSGSATFRY